ncbi:MAG: type II toxin-antitoxin system PemK/MazF family toxin [Gammaproteobacteria bacterium]|nr:type II toxin-antitoxin system PemK/MazF family toxin [Gammaproteobacteria bacterium]
MTRHIVIYDPYSIVVVPFPFADKKAAKKRPALVLSEKIFQTHTGHTTMLMITSATHNHWYSDIDIQDLETAGLTSASLIRQKIFTIDLRLVIKQIGILAPAEQKKLQHEISNNIAIRKNHHKSQYTIHQPDTTYKKGSQNK